MQEVAQLDLPDKPHFCSTAFQKWRAQEEAFHNWAFDWHLAHVEGQWWEPTRGLPLEGHAHTHVLLWPPDGNNYPLWSAAAGFRLGPVFDHIWSNCNHNWLPKKEICCNLNCNCKKLQENQLQPVATGPDWLQQNVI
ncbi:hypothetical protein EDB83DRAFT_2318155 [Lactarius deliciosus]|nr:hypothetical protein EDB83DRAFT_2318155 [Lactarius deliciosus]